MPILFTIIKQKSKTEMWSRMSSSINGNIIKSVVPDSMRDAINHLIESGQYSTKSDLIRTAVRDLLQKEGK
jgi:hypothetical protein